MTTEKEQQPMAEQSRTPAPDWLTPGAEAVILQPHNISGYLRAETVTVDRVLKRDVVLSNGDRFRLDRLSRQVGGTWGSTYYLVPATDPRVAEVRAALRLSNLRSRASSAYEDWRRNKVDARQVAEAFLRLAEAEELTEHEEG